MTASRVRFPRRAWAAAAAFATATSLVCAAPAGAKPARASAASWHCDVTAYPPDPTALVMLQAYTTVTCTVPAYVVLQQRLVRSNFLPGGGSGGQVDPFGVVITKPSTSLTGNLTMLVSVPCKRPGGVSMYGYGGFFLQRVFMVATFEGQTVVTGGDSYVSRVGCSN